MNQTAWDKIWDPLIALLQQRNRVLDAWREDGTVDVVTWLGEWKATMAEADPLTEALAAAGRGLGNGLASSYEAALSTIDGIIRGEFLGRVWDRLDIDGDYKPASKSPLDIVRSLQLNALATTAQTLQRNEPTVGSVAYSAANQGDGTITIAYNPNATLREMLLAGNIQLVNLNENIGSQGDGRWQLKLTDALEREFVSPTVFRTGEATEDIRLDSGLQRPTFGAGYYSGCAVEITEPDYDSVGESGDSDGAFANWDFAALATSQKTVCNRFNTTYAYDGSGRNGTVYVRCEDLTGSWRISVYKESTLDTLLAGPRVYTEGSGDMSNWQLLVAPQNPSAFNSTAALEDRDPTPFLEAGVDVFCEVDIDDSALTLNGASFTVTLTVNLPWAQGDKADVVATNSYAGTVVRGLVETIGIPLAPVASSPTIEEPAA